MFCGSTDIAIVEHFKVSLTGIKSITFCMWSWSCSDGLPRQHGTTNVMYVWYLSRSRKLTSYSTWVTPLAHHCPLSGKTSATVQQQTYLAVHIVKINNGLLDILCVRKVVEYLDIFGIGLYLDIFHYFPGKYVVDFYNIVNQDKSLYKRRCSRFSPFSKKGELLNPR